MINNKTNALICISDKLPMACHLPGENVSITCHNKINTALTDAANLLGFDYIRYCHWVNNLIENTQDIDFFSVNISTFPEAWEGFYSHERIYLVDPVVCAVRENIGQKNLMHGTWNDAYSWAVKNTPGKSAAEKALYAEKLDKLIVRSRQYQLNSGYYYAWGDSAVQMVVSLASTNSRFEPSGAVNGDFIRIIHSMVVLVRQAIAITQGCHQCSQSVRITGGNPIHLSPAELYVLQLFHKHRNASLKQIAMHYGRSLDTVNHHLRSVRSKLTMPGASGHSLATYASELKLI